MCKSHSVSVFLSEATAPLVALYSVCLWKEVDSGVS